MPIYTVDPWLAWSQGRSRQAHPLPVARAGCRSSRHSDQKKPGGPSAQWRRQPCDSMFPRFADPLPLERRNDVVSFVSGVACCEEEASRRPSSWRKVFSIIKVFSRNGILDRRCARNTVFRSRLAHLMRVSRAVRWRRAKNRLGHGCTRYSSNRRKTLMERDDAVAKKRCHHN